MISRRTFPHSVKTPRFGNASPYAAITRVVGDGEHHAQKNQPQGQNRRAARERRRGKSRTHIRRPRRDSVAQSSNRVGGKSGRFCNTSWPRPHSFECHFEWKETP